MFGINGGEIIVLLVVIGLVVGPQRLPQYAEQLGRLVRDGRAYLAQARTRVQEELGDQGADVDWTSLDPRRYDPRRIVRDALLDPVAGSAGTARAPGAAAGVAAGAAAGAAGSGTGAPRSSAPSFTPSTARLEPGQPAPFDVDAT